MSVTESGQLSYIAAQAADARVNLEIETEVDGLEFAFIRREADRMGLGVEVHAGEMGPPESIAASLDLLGADRIGHGVAAADDPGVAVVVLTGSEVKSLREGKAQIAEGYARVQRGEMWLDGIHIPPYTNAIGFGAHDPDRQRKLLLHRREIDRMRGWPFGSKLT